MQLIYIFAMMLVISAYALVGTRPNEDPMLQRSVAVASLMNAWHKDAIHYCLNNPCSTGPVDMRSKLSEPYSNSTSPFFSRLKTRYDETSKQLVTYVDLSNMAYDSPTPATVRAGMSVLLGETTAANAGIFSKSTRTISASYNEYSLKVTPMTISTILAASIPDGVPIILSEF